MSRPTPDDIIARAADGQSLETSAQCRTVIVQLEIDIAGISEQLTLADLGERENDPLWRMRAEKALYFKRRSAYLLRARMGELARHERQIAHAEHQGRKMSEARSKAQEFVVAAREMLPPDVFDGIWAAANARAQGAGSPHAVSHATATPQKT